MIDNSVVTLESVLNEYVFTKENFFNELLDKALELNVINEYEYDGVKSNIVEAMITRSYEIIEDLSYGFENATKVLMHNYEYAVSRYLYQMKPADALVALKENTSEKILAKAVRSFEKEVSSKYYELEANEKKVKGKFSGKYKTYFSEIKNILKKYFLLESPENLVDITEDFLLTSYIPLSFNYFGIDKFQNAINYADSLYIEYCIRSKIGLEAIKKIEKKDSKKREVNEKIKEIKYKKDEEIARINLEKKIKAMEIKRGSELTSKEKAELLDYEMLKLDEKYSAESFAEFEFENSLVDAIVEFIVFAVSMDGVKVPTNSMDKRDFVRKMDSEKMFEVLFSHEEVFEFSEEEKEYLRKYLIGNI